MRIILFLATNAAVLLLISVIFQVLGLEHLLIQNGVNLNLQGLLIISGIIGFGGSIISLLMSKWSAKRFMRVRLIEQPSDDVERWLLDTVRRQAQQAKIGMPEVGIFDSQSPNAFATGANKNNALVAVSRGLLQIMNRDEVEAVLGHEVSHVANGDMMTLTLISGVVNTFVIFFSRIVGHAIDRIVFRSERGFGPGYFIGSIVAQIIFSFIANIIVAWFSRRREFRADAGGAALSSRQNMANALRRLQQLSNPEPLPDQFAAFGISGGLAGLFRTHPPLEDRIARLESAH